MATVAQYIYRNVEEIDFWVSQNELQVKCYCLLKGPVCKIVEKVSFHTNQIPMLAVGGQPDLQAKVCNESGMRLINQLSYKLGL